MFYVFMLSVVLIVSGAGILFTSIRLVGGADQDTRI